MGLRIMLMSEECKYRFGNRTNTGLVTEQTFFLHVTKQKLRNTIVSVYPSLTDRFYYFHVDLARECTFFQCLTDRVSLVYVLELIQHADIYFLMYPYNCSSPA